MRTPAYGANTVRTEFAALTGLSEQALGLDRFNPYAAFARVPVDSIAWRLRAAGFRTICVHPFASSFYGRNRIMPNLGFDEFLDIGAFKGCGGGRGYVSDSAVVRKVTELLAKCGPRTFVFAITIGNHSPWPASPLASEVDHRAWPQFRSFLAGLVETDAALGQMADTMAQAADHGLLAAFGDHQPAFSSLFRHLGHVDRSTDYLIWQANQGSATRQDILAHELPGLVLRDSLKSGLARLRMLESPA